MPNSPWLLICPVLAGMVLADAAAAQPALQQGQATTQRQRAPGVPMVPNAGEAQNARPDGERARAMRERDRMARDRSAPPEPNREVPMPKPVPPIMAPTR